MVDGKQNNLFCRCDDAMAFERETTKWLMKEEGKYSRPASIPSTRTSDTFLSTVLTPSFTVSVALLRATKVVEKARVVIGVRVARRMVRDVRNDIVCLVFFFW